MPIAWTMPDGSVRVMTLSERYLAESRLEGETTDQAVARLAELERPKSPDLAQATFALVRSSEVPAIRADRHKWRVRGRAIVVDPAIPDRP